MADEGRPDGFETKSELRQTDGFETESELKHIDFGIPYPEFEPLPTRGLGSRLVAIAGLILVLAGLGCLIYMAARAILGDGFDWMPWLPLGAGLIIGGAICWLVSEP